MTEKLSANNVTRARNLLHRASFSTTYALTWYKLPFKVRDKVSDDQWSSVTLWFDPTLSIYHPRRQVVDYIRW